MLYELYEKKFNKCGYCLDCPESSVCKKIVALEKSLTNHKQDEVKR